MDCDILKNCPNCGETVKDDKKFCPKCGASLTVAKAENGSSLNKNILFIAIALILCVAILAGAMIMMNNSDNSSDDAAVENNDDSVNAVGSDDAAVENNDDSVNAVGSDDASRSSSALQILDGTISTGSSLDAKTLCRVYVGEEHNGENVKISVLYWRDGKKLNEGKVVKKTVDSTGYIDVYSAKAFTKFPDEAYITLYDAKGVVVDEKDVLLETNNKVQSINS